MKRTILAVCLLAGATTFAAAQYGPPQGPPPPGAQYGPPPPGGQYGPPSWDQGWDRRPFPRSGACFFSNANFQGHRFCMNSGDSWQSLPVGFGDNISSIQVFGRARVLAFDNRGFQAERQMFMRSVQDLRRWPVQGRPGKTWNNRISSIRVF